MARITKKLKKRATTLWLEPDVSEWLNRQRKELGRTISWNINEAVRRLILADLQ